MMLTRTKRTAPNFAIDSHGHPQTVVMLPAIFGGGTMRHGQPGLATNNSMPTQLSYGEVWTTGTHVQWVIGVASDNGAMGSWWLQASWRLRT